jgi:hypothetical protein
VGLGDVEGLGGAEVLSDGEGPGEGVASGAVVSLNEGIGEGDGEGEAGAETGSAWHCVPGEAVTRGLTWAA